MKIAKKITQVKLFRVLLGKLIYFYLLLVHKTGKWSVHKPEHVDLSLYLGKPVIYAFWHGKLAMMPFLSPVQIKMNVLISGHRDGDIIAEAMKCFGFGIISGSSKKGGTAALRNIVRKLKAGENIAITPDGPRGPAIQVQGSIINIAGLTGTPIIPISFSCRKAYRFNTWDKFLLPWLCSEGALVYGMPISVPKNLDDKSEQNLKLLLKTELDRISNEADSMFDSKEA